MILAEKLLSKFTVNLLLHMKKRRSESYCSQILADTLTLLLCNRPAHLFKKCLKLHGEPRVIRLSKTNFYGCLHAFYTKQCIFRENAVGHDGHFFNDEYCMNESMFLLNMLAVGNVFMLQYSMRWHIRLCGQIITCKLPDWCWAKNTDQD